MKNKHFNELVESLNEAIAIDRGIKKPSRIFDVKPNDVAQIRKDANKSQAEFAEMIGVSVGTLRNWEQGRRKPEGPAAALLKIVSADPNYVERILHA